MKFKGIAWWIASHLPASVKYWAGLQVACAVAATDEDAGQLTTFEVYKRWYAFKDLGD